MSTQRQILVHRVFECWLRIRKFCCPGSIKANRRTTTRLDADMDSHGFGESR